MAQKIMVLPSVVFNDIKVCTIPEDMEEHEAFRHVTGLIASFQEDATGSYEGLDELLEEKGFSLLSYSLGPELDKL